MYKLSCIDKQLIISYTVYMKIFQLITDIFNVSAKASRIKSDEERRPKSAHFAVTAIIYSVILAVSAGVGGWLFKTSIGLSELTDIILIVCAAILALVAVASLIAAIVRLIAQFTINRSVWSWVALAVFIAAVAAAAVMVVLL